MAVGLLLLCGEAILIEWLCAWRKIASKNLSRRYVSVITLNFVCGAAFHSSVIFRPLFENPLFNPVQPSPTLSL